MILGPTLSSESNVVWHAAASHAGEERADRTGATVWLTGLSGSGKSTVAVERRAAAGRGRAGPPTCSTATTCGTGSTRDLGFSAGDRAENVRRVGEVAQLLADAGVVALAPLISPYRADRDRVRRRSTRPPACRSSRCSSTRRSSMCEARDPKGLYAKARAGEITGFTGVDDPYEAPEHAELVLTPDDGDPARRPCGSWNICLYDADAEFAADLAARAGELLPESVPGSSVHAARPGPGAGAGEARRQGGQRAAPERLAAARPADAVLSEESADDTARLTADRVWIIDPLDGTREFAEPAARRLGRPRRAVGGRRADRRRGRAARARRDVRHRPRRRSYRRATAARTGSPVSAPGRRPSSTALAAELGAELVPMGSAGAKAMAVRARRGRRLRARRRAVRVGLRRAGRRRPGGRAALLAGGRAPLRYNETRRTCPT